MAVQVLIAPMGMDTGLVGNAHEVSGRVCRRMNGQREENLIAAGTVPLQILILLFKNQNPCCGKGAFVNNL
ncbi:hypothetical protein FW774_02415 (plasmid) [Pedobacter sp. BS3]|nr:hypothetical protein FW774_02415 [Pedobacter sp. BS3]